MALTGIYGAVSKSDALRTIHRALDLGIRHFDTAELYGPFRNEELLAEALAGADVTIATKVGYRIEDGNIRGLDNRPDTLRRSVEGCLRRLRRERIDLVYLHRVDTAVPVEDSIGALANLVDAGKIAGLGLSAVNRDLLDKAAKIHPIYAVQNEMSLIHRHAQNDILPTAEARGIRLVAFSPLGRGILAGTAIDSAQRSPDDFRRAKLQFHTPSLTAIDAALKPFWDIAAAREIDPAVIAIAWLLSQSPAVLVLPGAKTAQQISICCQAGTIHLCADEIRKLNQIEICG